MKIGFIGSGKMAQAMIGGMLSKEHLSNFNFIASAKTEKTREEVSQKFSIQVTKNNSKVAEDSDILFLAIPPQEHDDVIDGIKESIKPSVIIITVAAGKTMSQIENAFGSAVKVVRTMPNTPSLVGEGMVAYCYNNHVTAKDIEIVTDLLSSMGKIDYVDEQHMDAIPAVSGASPAYVYMMIEALGDGGVLQGLPRQQAYQLAAQAVLGAAKMVIESGKHPGELKDQVCSPGGATIEAVAKLEENGFRHAIIEAMNACTNKVNVLDK